MLQLWQNSKSSHSFLVIFLRLLIRFRNLYVQHFNGFVVQKVTSSHWFTKNFCFWYEIRDVSAQFPTVAELALFVADLLPAENRLHTFRCRFVSNSVIMQEGTKGSHGDSPANKVRIGHYILGETLGVGTFGKVKCKFRLSRVSISC